MTEIEEFFPEDLLIFYNYPEPFESIECGHTVFLTLWRIEKKSKKKVENRKTKIEKISRKLALSELNSSSRGFENRKTKIVKNFSDSQPGGMFCERGILWDRDGHVTGVRKISKDFLDEG